MAGPHSEGGSPGRTTSDRVIDATPAGDVTAEYGLDALREAGYVSDARVDVREIDDGTEIRFLRSGGPARLAYFEIDRKDLDDTAGQTVQTVVRELRYRTRYRHFWFVDPEQDRVQIYRTASGVDRFVYDPSRHDGPVRERKRETLDRIGEDLSVLFDTGPVDQFCEQLRDHRARLARAVRTRSGRRLPARERLLAAQRMIDRLIFVYFLLERDVIVAVDGDRRVRRTSTPDVWESLVEETDDFGAFLDEVWFAYLGSPDDSWIPVVGDYSLYVPCLDSDVVQPTDVQTADGTTVSEREDLVVEGYDWRPLVEQFDEYSWIVDGLDTCGDAHAGELTPAVLGQIYEQFVVTASHMDSGADVSGLTGSRDEGNPEVGAYYTGDGIADFVSRRALWEAARERIEGDIDAGEAPEAVRDCDLYDPALERRRDVEESGKTGFDVFMEAYGENRRVVEYLDGVLAELTVCDPAIGSGAFALAVANVLFEWRMHCRPDRDPVQLRGGIVSNNVFGVDVMERATDICTLRLWLWIVGSVETDVEDGEYFDGHEPFASCVDIGHTIRSGNSLLGLVEPLEQGSSGAVGVAARLDEYRDAVERRQRKTESVPGRRALDQQYATLKRQLDASYADCQVDASNDPVRFEHRVESATEAVASVNHAPDSATLVVDGDAALPDSLASVLEEQGFRTWTYRARSSAFPRDGDAIRELYRHVDTERGVNADGWHLAVEREYVGADFHEDRLDACHWVLEFPRVFLPGDRADESGRGFDLVVSNPPYGAELSAGEEGVLTNECHYSCQGASDSYEWFYERAFDLAREGGVVSFVVNKSNVAFYRNGADIRERILDETTLAHVLDIGQGFGGVDLETIALIHRRADGSQDVAAPAIHQTSDPKRPTANSPQHRGWFPQRSMRENGRIVFAPVSPTERAALERITGAGHRLGDLVSRDAFRELELWVKERERDDRLAPGSDHFLGRGPYVRDYHLEDTWHVDLGEYRDEIAEYAVPRVIMKSVRGTRLRAWIDERGELVSNGKTVGAPFEGHDADTIAFVYAALNHPCVSFYLQKAVFSETTETARVMDSQYSHSIPIPAASEPETAAVAALARALTMAEQIRVDGGNVRPDTVASVRNGVEALVGALYLEDDETGVQQTWAADVCESVDTGALASTFEAFYTARFASESADPQGHWADALGHAETVRGAVDAWSPPPSRVLDDELIRAVTAVL